MNEPKPVEKPDQHRTMNLDPVKFNQVVPQLGEPPKQGESKGEVNGSRQ
jgi:hypothetical protein